MKVLKTVKLEDVKAISLIARRWFCNSDGNTYHSVYVSALVSVGCANELNANVYNRPLKDGEVWIDLANEYFRYGYDRCFDQTALELFNAACTHQLPGCGSLSRFCQEMDIPYTENIYDVKRKKDL